MKENIICSGALFYSTSTKRFLFLQRTDEKTRGTWGLVGGMARFSESAFEGLKREIEEETGLKLKINNNTYSIKINDTLYYIFVVDEHSHIPKPMDVFEIKDSKWIYMSDLDIFSCNRGLKKLHSSYKERVINLAKNTIKAY